MPEGTLHGRAMSDIRVGWFRRVSLTGAIVLVAAAAVATLTGGGCAPKSRPTMATTKPQPNPEPDPTASTAAYPGRLHHAGLGLLAGQHHSRLPLLLRRDGGRVCLPGHNLSSSRPCQRRPRQLYPSGVQNALGVRGTAQPGLRLRGQPLHDQVEHGDGRPVARPFR